MSMMVQPHRFGSSAPVAPSVSGSARTVENTSGLTNTVSSASPVAGELIILFLTHGTNLASGTPITWPSGFTQGGRAVSTNVAAAGAWAWKIATGSEPSTYTVSWGSGSTRSILSCIRIQNHDGFDSEFINSTGSNSLVPRSGATTGTTAPCMRLWLYAGGYGSGTMTVTPPTTTPAITTVLPGVLTSTGTNTNGTASYVAAKEEPTTTLGLLTFAMSFSAHVSGVNYVAFTIPIKRL